MTNWERLYRDEVRAHTATKVKLLAAQQADRAYANARYSELLKAHRELLASVKPRAHTAKRDTPVQDMTDEQIIQYMIDHPKQVTVRG